MNPPTIRRARRVGNEWHVTYTNGQRETMPVLVNGAYQSRAEYWRTRDQYHAQARPS